MRVHVDDLPRIESTRISSGARSLATFLCFFFHLSNPASAAFLSGELAITRSGMRVRFVERSFDAGASLVGEAAFEFLIDQNERSIA